MNMEFFYFEQKDIFKLKKYIDMQLATLSYPLTTNHDIKFWYRSMKSRTLYELTFQVLVQVYEV